MIKIDDLLPLLKKGWVAMDGYGDWSWHPYKPKKEPMPWKCWYSDGMIEMTMFDIAPADDWKESLIRVKGND